MNSTSLQFRNLTTLENPGPATIADAIQLQAALHPKRPAIVTSYLPIFTFQDLSELIRSVGEQLHAAGIGASSRVGIVLPNGPESAVIAVAVAAHAIAFPLNSALTTAEFEFEFTRANLDTVVLPGWIDLLATASARACSIGILYASKAITSLADVGLKQIVEISSARQRSGVPSLNSVSVIQMSSGSTGIPKLILVTHANLFDIADKMQTWFGLSRNDRCACILPINSGFGFKITLVAPLLIGSSVAIANNPQPEDIAVWSSELDPTWFVATPTYLHTALDKLRSANGGKIAHSLRFFASTSARLPEAVRTGLEAILEIPGLEFYGLREAGIVAANPAPPATRKLGTVGLVSDDVAVLDGDGTILPRGEVGALAVRGKGVSPGYIDALPPERDTVPDADMSLKEWVPTGDLGIIDADGFLSVVGRIKEIINRGGEKIAPSEIEQTLLLHPAVRESVAFGVPHPRLGENVAAAVVLKPETEVTPSELHSFLCEHLATFKVPQRVYVTSILPRTATGKVRKSELIENLSNGDRHKIVPPEGDLELLIAGVWQRMLDRTDIGIDDNFFEAGGDSLLAIEMLVEVEALARRRIPLSALQAVFTIRQLAAAIVRNNPVEDELITYAKDGTGRPFFFCHGDDNYRGIYALRLADMIDQDFPVVLLNPRPDYDAVGRVRIEDVARLYVPHLLAAQPTGQFRIGGFCFAGLLAWEIAHQLANAGREVEFVVLIDSPSLNGRFILRVAKKVLNLVARISPSGTREEMRLNGMGLMWFHVRKIAVSGRPQYWQLLSGLLRNAFKVCRDVFKNRPLSTVPDALVESVSVQRHRYRSMSNYIPPYLDAEVFCLVCDEYATRMDYSPLAWNRLSRVVHIKQIPGRHHTCLTTLAGELANELRQIFSTRRSEVKAPQPTNSLTPKSPMMKSNDFREGVGAFRAKRLT